MDGHYVCFLPSFVFLLLHLIGMMVHGASTEDFISIDCGSPNDTGVFRMTYVSDRSYIDTGVTHELPENQEFFRGYNSPLKYLRSFPDGERNCYKIGPVDKGQKYLVRARFWYGNFDGNNSWPQFDVYLGVHFWKHVTSTSASHGLISEILTVASSSSLSVCLQDIGDGTPFISVIAVRPLPDHVYPMLNSSSPMRLLQRRNAGADGFSRYPDDTHDRSWWKLKADENRKNLNGTDTIQTLTGANDVPADAMKTAVTPVNDSSINIEIPELPNAAANDLYVILYFAELDELPENESRIFHVLADGQVISEDIKPKYLQASTFSHSLPASFNNKMLSITKSNGSTLPPILNAHEIYWVTTTESIPIKGARKLLVVILPSITFVMAVLLVACIVILKLRRKKVSARLIPSLHFEIKKFKFDELVKITSNFKTQIGKGGFGIVYNGIHGNGILVAVKMLFNPLSQGQQEFLTEVELLSRIRHRNLVSLIGYCDDVDHLALVYEYIAGGSLDGYLSGKVDTVRSFSWRERLRIAKEAAQGLEYLHKGCKPIIIHRDVKPSNILLTQNFEVKIADFGMSKIFQSESNNHVSTRVVGTIGYIDPTYYTSNQLTEKSDVYSFGVVLLELITGQPAIIKTEENTFIADWVRPRLQRAEMRDVLDRRIEEGSYDLDCTWKAVEIAMTCIEYDISKRPTMTEVVAQLNECLELEKACQRAQSSSPCAEEHAMARMAPDSDSSMMHPKAR